MELFFVCVLINLHFPTIVPEFLLLIFLFRFLILYNLANYWKNSQYTNIFPQHSRVIHVFMDIFHCDGLLGPLTSTSLLSFVESRPISSLVEPC
jgi:hypothetical protein